ncbi:MAG: carbohydrate-binding domain-containing protein [Clostridia bacterium]|nr:carbohydrate-binding domain-containing protein [Clostridia bacterium]
MRFSIALLLLVLCLGTFSGCQVEEDKSSISESEVLIVLDDAKITADGQKVSEGSGKAVHVANDIVYYESGKDFTYGEGGEKDAHDADEANKHTVLHISEAGTYRLQGKLSCGQIAVDLGEDAKEDPKAVVTLILDGVDVTCTVAPALIFYNVYECGNTDTEKATKDVDTSKAGANVILADGSTNTVSGSYVERIYKPDSVVLNEEKTEVEDAKKLHKYDGAFYSKMSMNVGGEKEGSGILNINAENEGLDSELHLTINGGVINIRSGNDGINTNEDGVSVTTINGGALSIRVTGETGEGDGIDSNGWLVINRGSVTAEACSTSGDAGIDSDNGIHINGGTVAASGSMLDRIEDGGQTYAVFNFSQKQKEDKPVQLKNKDGNVVLEAKPENDFSILILSSPDLIPGVYTLWSGETQLAGLSGGMMGGAGMRPAVQMPEGQTPPEMPEGQTPPEMPEGQTPPEMPDGQTPPEMPKGEDPRQDFAPENGKRPNDRDSKFPGENFGSKEENGQTSARPSAEFTIREGANTFSAIMAINEAIIDPEDTEALRQAYPQFFNLPTEEGLVVYVWQMAENDYNCHLSNKVIGALSDQSFIFKAGATVSEMKTILSTYEIEKENIRIQPVINPMSSYYYEINADYIAKINALFD